VTDVGPYEKRWQELGRDTDARSEAAEILRISPKFSRASLLGFKNFTSHPHWDDDLHDAGISEALPLR
jgi:hypothetical protein